MFNRIDITHPYRCDGVLESDFDDDNFMLYCIDVSEPYQGNKYKDFGNYIPVGKDKYEYEAKR
jgi:hypothetical protein